MKRFWLFSFLCGLLLAVSACMKPTVVLPGQLIGPPSPSPDGRLVAFTYGGTAENNWLLLYDIAENSLRLIEKPARLIVSSPSFSPDGERLVVATYCKDGCRPDEANSQIAVLNIAEGKFQFVTADRNFVRQRPIFSADGTKVFFSTTPLLWREESIAAGVRWPEEWGEAKAIGYDGLSQVDLPSLRETPLFPTETWDLNFSYVRAAGATNTGDLIVSADGPHGADLDPIVAAFSKRNVLYSTIAYVYRHPRHLKPLRQGPLMHMSSVSSTSDGKKQVFVSSPPDDKYNYDLFQLVGGEVSQVTHLKTHLSVAKISGNGRRIVFLADATRKRDWSVWIYDSETGESRSVLDAERLLKFLQPYQTDAGAAASVE